MRAIDSLGKEIALPSIPPQEQSANEPSIPEGTRRIPPVPYHALSSIRHSSSSSQVRPLSLRRSTAIAIFTLHRDRIGTKTTFVALEKKRLIILV